MSELNVHVEALISAAARAFYDDFAICVVDVLLREKFLRDHTMATQLHLPVKRLRATLQFLQDEHLVQTISEKDDDYNYQQQLQTGARRKRAIKTKFYYLDYCRAAHTIRLRVFLMQQNLRQTILQLQESTYYVCPGYEVKRCLGRYTEQQAQQLLLDHSTGLFLCHDCGIRYQNDPHAPPIETYTLMAEDNTKELKQALEAQRRFSVQMSAKSIGDHQLRPGIYDLLQKLFDCEETGRQLIISNLPSDNLEFRAPVVVADDPVNSALLVRNARGHVVRFSVEVGGGARAQLLASKRRRRSKLLEIAAIRLGASLPLHLRLAEEVRRRKEEEEQQDERKPRKLVKSTPFFLEDDFGRGTEEDGDAKIHAVDDPANVSRTEGKEEIPLQDQETELVLMDDSEDSRQLSDETRLHSFISQYQPGMDRYAEQWLFNSSDSVPTPFHSYDSVQWVDGGASPRADVARMPSAAELAERQRAEKAEAQTQA